MHETANVAGSVGSSQEERADLGLLRGIVRQERQALAALYDAYIAVVYKTAHSIVGEPAQAAHVVQQVFADLWSAPPVAGPAFDLAGWLTRSTRRHALSLVRPGLSARLQVSQDAPCEQAETQAAHPSRERVCQLLDRLQPLSREVIDLAYYSGLTVTEIAEQLAVSHEAVRGAVRMGLLGLRDELVRVALVRPANEK